MVILSEFYVNNNSKEEVLNTIHHEIAHALTPNYKAHGKKWKAVFKSLLIKYEQPVNVSRCYDSNEVKMPKGRYIVKCCNCKSQRDKHRMKRTLKLSYLNGGRRCYKCGHGEFTIEDSGVQLTEQDVVNEAIKNSTNPNYYIKYKQWKESEAK